MTISSLKTLERVPLGPTTVKVLPLCDTFTPAGINISCFPILLIYFENYYQILNKASPPTCSFLASLPDKIPFGVESTSKPEPFRTE